MKTNLQRYLLGQNLLYLGLCLLTCTGIYLLIDIFERLDRFLEKGAEIDTIVLYFLVKIPLIISQILPAVLLLALLVQLSLMQRDNEIVALESGGIPYRKLILFFVIYAIIWSGIQFGFSQYLGVPGQAKSEEIWDNLDKKKSKEEEVLKKIWIRKKNYMINMEKVWPKSQRASGVSVFRLNSDFTVIERVYLAESLYKQGSGWKLQGVELVDPQDFSVSTKKEDSLSLSLDLETLLTTKLYEDYEEMPFWQLSKRIEILRQSGSNVEPLVTAWHMKLSYAFTVVLMALIGIVVVRIVDNIYLNISLGLCVTFLFYHVYVLGGTLGEKGIVPSWFGAWLGHFLFGLPALFFLFRERGFKGFFHPKHEEYFQNIEG